VRDVLVVYRNTGASTVAGLIVEIPGKRRIFLSIGRVTSIGAGQIITTGRINLRRFAQRGGEVRVIAELLGRKVVPKDKSGEATIEDVAIERTAPGEWKASDLFLRRPRIGSSLFGTGPTVFAAWPQTSEKKTGGEAQSAEELPDSRLADKGLRSNFSSRFTWGNSTSGDRFGRFSESFARAMGTTSFLFILTAIVIVWLVWKSVAPGSLQLDSHFANFTLLTLILSLQASYAAPLILLAQNRQDDRDRVQIEQHRQRADRNPADTEYLAREVVPLRLAMKDVVTKDFIRAELRALLEELDASDKPARAHKKVAK